MRISLFLSFLLVFVWSAHSQSGYSRVKVDLTSADSGLIREAGIDLEHGHYLPHRFLISDLADYEIARVRQLGFEVEILIEDIVLHYQQQAQRSPLVCQQISYDYPFPDNFTFGSMGGYLTYQEMLNTLDTMAQMYPNLISTRQQAGNEQTHEGRILEWVRISDNPNTDEAEPEILYTGLHHAREPMSMMQMIYYMWHLLENYTSSSEIKYLIDNTEMYFIPCINPDGYEYNRTIAPDGGGIWRKNMRDNNNDGVFIEEDDGVDLNRNYSYQWGLDGEGSSGAEGSATYRGPGAFSEPETRAVRDFVEAHNFTLALNYHAYGNFLIYPWGYSGSQNPDSLVYQNYGDLLSVENGFKHGTPSETVGYLVNGSATDWMYAERDIIAITPELGDSYYGFWPPQDVIIPLCQASLRSNLSLAHLTHKYAVATDINNDFLTSNAGVLEIGVIRYGLGTGTMALSVESLSPALDIMGSLQEVGFEPFTEEVYAYDYQLDGTAVPGDDYGLVIKVDNGFFETRDTIYKTFGALEVPFEDLGDEMTNWTQPPEATWGTTTEAARSGESSLTDSPGGPYQSSLTNVLTILEPVSLRDAFYAELEFWAKWEIEEVIDYALVQISTDGENFHNLCGQHAVPGSIFQLYGEPLYHGTQPEWVRERIDLSPYLGEDIFIRFVMVSDGFYEQDGIYLDDIRIHTYSEESVSAISLEQGHFAFTQFPNPTDGDTYVNIHVPGKTFQSGSLVVFNALGQPVLTKTLRPADLPDVPLPLTHLPTGVYNTALFIDGQFVQARRIVRASR